VEPLLTVGHGRLDADELTALLLGAGVGGLVDVRRYPGSRRNPSVGRDHLAEVLPASGIEYRWDERLGGRRRLPDADDADPWWTVDAFRAYAAHTRTQEFVEALDELLGQAARTRTTVMCSEAVWWRCHRRLIADVASVGHGLDVLHLMPDGKLRPHRPAEGARRRDDDLVVWDGAATPDLDQPTEPG
jgi:uncharacterized protein (DUF488 family)